jgi:hypothetical protein
VFTVSFLQPDIFSCSNMLSYVFDSAYNSTSGDLNETYFVGNVDEASKHLVRCAYECLDKAIAIGDILVIRSYF